MLLISNGDDYVSYAGNYEQYKEDEYQDKADPVIPQPSIDSEIECLIIVSQDRKEYFQIHQDAIQYRTKKPDKPYNPEVCHSFHLSPRFNNSGPAFQTRFDLLEPDTGKLAPFAYIVELGIDFQERIRIANVKRGNE